LSLPEKLRSFHARRIRVPVPPEGLVLDVGSGDKPSWRLPFADCFFDYVICSHVLEHVPDPAAVIGELTRVARAGYIEVPRAAPAQLQDFPTHLWWCRLDESRERPTLVLTAKQTPYFDAEIDAYLREANLEKQMARLLQSRFEKNIVQLWWSGEVSFRIEGELDPEFVRRTVTSGAPHHGTGVTTASRVLTRLMTGRGHRPRPLAYDDVVKPALRTGTGQLLEPRIYRA
jgi:SAM-dependent methyltransferase